LTYRVERARILRALFAAYAALCVIAYVIPSDVGANVARLRFAAIPIAVLTLSLRRWKPWPVSLIAVVLACSWNLSPLAYSLVRSSSDPSAVAAYWQPAITFLQRSLTPGYRVEAVDTTGHWEAVYLTRAGIPIVRGWFRQDDFPQNEVLYSKLGPRAYVSWLHGLGVGYVVLARTTPDYSARAESALVQSGRAGLTKVYDDRTIAIYRVPDFRPIVTGPGKARVVALTQARIVVSVPRGGEYRIAVRWSPYWRTSDGCLSRGKDGMLRLTTLHPRVAKIGFIVSADSALDQLAGQRPSCTLP